MQNNNIIRKIPVIWITLATFLIVLLVNLPLIYGYFSVHGKYIWKLWGYAPHQFVFLLVPLPMATFATLVALTIIFSTLTNSPDAHSALRWCGQNWVVIILFGFILSTLFAVFDYYGNPKVFDRLESEFAKKAATSASEVRFRNENITGKSKILAINKNADIHLNSLRSDPDVTRQELLDLDPDVYLRLVKDPWFQRKFQLLNPVSHLLSELQLTFALFVGFGALFASFLLFISYFSPGSDLTKASPAVITALAFMALYPLCFGYWSAEINILTGKPINNVGYIIVAGLILIIGVLLIAVDINIRSITGNIATALPVMLTVLAVGATKTVGIQNLRIIIGVDANPATRFFVIISLLLVGIILATMLVIQYEGSFIDKK
jgi:hypothetical protein